MFRLASALVILAVLGLGCQQRSTTDQSSSSSAATATTSAPPATPTPAETGAARTTASGLKIEDLEIGTGAEALTGKRVSVHYTGRLTDGTKFDSSLDRGTPYQVTLGAGEVIPGWDEGIVGMRIGGKRRLTIPPQLAYGESGRGGIIPPNATLVFDLELMDVK